MSYDKALKIENKIGFFYENELNSSLTDWICALKVVYHQTRARVRTHTEVISNTGHY